MVDTAIDRDVLTTDIYERMGLRTVINGAGAATLVGGTLMRPETVAAMAEASRAFVVMDELNARVGERIAEVHRRGSRAASPPVPGRRWRSRRPPASPEPIRSGSLAFPTAPAWRMSWSCTGRTGIHYDQAYRVGGGKIVEIGVPYATRSLGARARDHRADRRGRLARFPQYRPRRTRFATVVEIAHAKGVPVIVDAASTLPPVDHLKIWIRNGRRSRHLQRRQGDSRPARSGMLAGRKDLIEAARLQRHRRMPRSGAA